MRNEDIPVIEEKEKGKREEGLSALEGSGVIVRVGIPPVFC